MVGIPVRMMSIRAQTPRPPKLNSLKSPYPVYPRYRRSAPKPPSVMLDVRASQWQFDRGGEGAEGGGDGDKTHGLTGTWRDREIEGEVEGEDARQEVALKEDMFSQALQDLQREDNKIKPTLLLTDY